MKFPVKLPRISPWLGEAPIACHPHFSPPPKEAVPWPEAIEGRWDVAVAGAGLSGLTAAYHLKDRQVMVLEAGETPGGVCQQGSYRGVDYPAGSAYFYYPWNGTWQSWYRELELPVDEAVIRQPVSALYQDRRWHPDCFSKAGLRQLPLPPGAVEGLVRLAEELAAREEGWDPLGSDSLPDPELDRISLADYLRRVHRLPLEARRLFDPYCRSCLGAGPEAVSAWAGIFFLMAEFSPKSQAAAFPQGNARLAQALAQALPQPPRTGQILVRLEPSPDAVRLLMWDSRENRPYRLEAGVVILAMGKFAARHLLTPACGWNLEDFKAFRYSSYLVAALCGQISLDPPGYENWVVGEESFTDVVMASRSYRPGEDRVMTVFAPQPYPEGRAPLRQARPEDKARELLQTVERLWPGTAREVEEVRLYRFGHAQVVPYPGFLTFLKGRIPQQQGRLILANSDLEGLPCIEAAIVQGQKAARLARSAMAK